MEKSGRIEVIVGCMMAGKTTELMRRIRRYAIAGCTVVVIKYSKDIRYDAMACSSHDGSKMDAIPVMRLADAKDVMAAVDVVGIDEGQFFPDVPEVAEALANAGKTVIVAALDGTYKRQPFGRIMELLPISESFTKLNAVCTLCHKDAAFSDLLIPNVTNATEIIGGQEKYSALCRACFLKRHPNNIEWQPFPQQK